LVIRYAVDASARPYIRTPTSGIFTKMKKPRPKPKRTPARSLNQTFFSSFEYRTLAKYGSS
jgi:hypothetical protein